MDYEMIYFSLVEDGAILPQRSYLNSAGLDLSCIGRHVIYAGERVIVSTGLAVQMPDGVYGKIEARSSLAFNSGLIPLGGVVDANYQGVIQLCMLNTSTIPVFIEAGERVAQLVLNRVSLAAPQLILPQTPPPSPEPEPEPSYSPVYVLHEGEEDRAEPSKKKKKERKDKGIGSSGRFVEM